MIMICCLGRICAPGLPEHAGGGYPKRLRRPIHYARRVFRTQRFVLALFPASAFYVDSRGSEDGSFGHAKTDKTAQPSLHAHARVWSGMCEGG